MTPSFIVADGMWIGDEAIDAMCRRTATARLADIQFETYQNGLDGRQRLAPTKWIKIVPKCAVSPRFGTFLFLKRVYPLIHISIHLHPLLSLTS